MVILGVTLHALGGLAAGSFYIPFKGVRNWAWESYWIIGGFFAWIVMPWLLGFIIVPDLLAILRAAPASSLVGTFGYGILWGTGGVTFGLTLRYLGMSLGMAMVLGFTATFGTLIPPIYFGKFGDLVTSISGLITLAGILVCLAGIAICGWAGRSKEKELSEEEKKKAIKEFNFRKGIKVAVFSGIMSSCFAFGMAAGKPIAQAAVNHKTPDVWQNMPVIVLVLAGGFVTNCIYCVFLNLKNRSFSNYVECKKASLSLNYLFSSVAGMIAYMEFMFYGMGTTQMGKYDFSSWSIHMAFIIIFSNMWGLILHEWKGCSKRTIKLLLLGLFILIQTTMWLSAQAAIAEQYVTFDLGSPSDVDAVMIWNYNENETRPVMDRGVKEMDVLVSADNVTYRNAGRFSLEQAPGTQETNFSQIFPLERIFHRNIDFFNGAIA